MEIGVRSNTTIERISYAQQSAQTVVDAQTKACQYSPNGQYMAYIDQSGSLTIVELKSQASKVLAQNTAEFKFSSPSGAFISAFNRSVGEIQVYRISDASKLNAFKHKSTDQWPIGWAMNESIYLRQFQQGLQVYSVRDTEPYATIPVQNISGFSASSILNTVCVYSLPVGGNAGQVQLITLPKNGQEKSFTLSIKTVMNMDSVYVKWSLSQQHVLVQCTVESDKSNRSYYGQSQLYLLTAAGNFDTLVRLDKDGPIHDFEWVQDRSGQDDQFIVVFGDVPARACLFNHRGKKVFTFGESAFNTIRVSTQGRFVLLGGFGNLAGYVQIWDLWSQKGINQVATFQEDSAVYVSFADAASDQVVIVSATLSPRLRVDNRFRVRDLAGNLLYQKDYKELFWCLVRPSTHLICKESQVIIPVKQVQAQNGQQKTGEVKPQIPKSSYVPPHLRNKQVGVVGASFSNGKPAEQPKPAPLAQVQIQSAPAVPPKNEKVAAIEKKIIGTQRKLRAIQQLHLKLASGEKLERNQIDKLSTEDELKQTLGQLERELLLAESESERN